MATSGGRRFADEDEEAQYWLEFLRSGTPDSKVEARGHLSRIFERRGLLDEAIELLETNNRERGLDPELRGHLQALYRRAGRDGDIAVAGPVLLETRPDAASDPEDQTTRFARPDLRTATTADDRVSTATDDSAPPDLVEDQNHDGDGDPNAAESSHEELDAHRPWFTEAPAVAQSAQVGSGRMRRSGPQARRPASYGLPRENGTPARRGAGSSAAERGWTPAAIALIIFLIASTIVALLTVFVSLGSGGRAAAADEAAPSLASVGGEATPGATTDAQAGDQPIMSASDGEGGDEAGLAASPVAGALPSPEPVPVDPAAIRAYNTEVTPKLIVANAASARMSGLARRVSEKPELLGDPAWKRDMTAVLQDLRSIGQQLQRQLQVPATAEVVNNAIVTTGRDYVYIADELQAGIDGVNARRLQNAMTRANEVNARMPAITNALQALSAP